MIGVALADLIVSKFIEALPVIIALTVAGIEAFIVFKWRKPP